MRITKKQSLLISVGVICVVLLVGSLLLRLPTDSQNAASPDTEPVLSDEEIRQPLPENEPGSTFVLDNFHRVEHKNNKPVWEVKARKGQYLPETNSAKLEEAMIWVFREDGDVIQLRANQAVLYLNGTSLIRADASGDVVVTFNEKLSARTEAANYDRDKQTIYAPGKIAITNDKMVITGSEFEVDLEKETFRLQKKVDTVIHGEAEHEHTTS